MKRLPRLLLLSAFLSAFPAAAQQEEEEAAPTVVRVDVETRGSVPVDETFVRSFLSTKAGEPLDPVAFSADLRALLDSNRFSDASASISETEDGGVVATFRVEGRRRLAEEPVYVGLDAFSRSRAERESGLKPNDWVDETVAEAAAQRLRAYYLKNRYFDAVVTPVLVPRGAESPGLADLSFRIEEGPRYSVDFLSFPGATSISESDLGEYAEQHSWFNPVSWVTTPRLTDADLAVVATTARKKYFDAGYLDATVTGPRKEKDGTDLKVFYDVVEGPLYRIKSVRIDGATLFPESALLAEIPLRPGAPAGAAAIESARSAVRDYYVSRGYADTTVSPSTSASPGNAIDLVLHVREGGLVRVRSVNVAGNTVTKDKVVRREIALNPGDPLDLVRAENSRKRLQNSGFFSDVRFNDVPVKGDPGVRDVVYEVTEQGTGSLMVGAAYSSVDHLVGLFSVSQNNFDIANWRNFKGAGQKARLELTASGDSTSANASVVEPWFLDRRLALQVDAFLNERSYREYDIKRAGGSVGLEKFFPWVGRVNLTYSLQRAWMDDVVKGDFHPISDPSSVYRFTDEDDGYLLGSMRLSWIYDTRDNPIVPKDGTRAVAAATLYDGAFGSDFDFWVLDARAFTYFSLPFGFYLSLSGEAGTADGFGGDEVPIGSRFFMGGGRHARGFRHRHLGPKATPAGAAEDSRTFSPTGGRTQAWATAELSVPIIENVRFATFLDAGNVWDDSFDMDFGEIATSAGVGIRLDFMSFPVRFDYAHVMDSPDDYARHRNFVIWFGWDN